MDLKLVKVIDALLNGEEEPSTRLYIPTIVKKGDIEMVSPNITQKGKLYRNLSIIKTYSGDSHMVVGNYIKLSKIVEDKYTNKQIGYR